MGPAIPIAESIADAESKQKTKYSLSIHEISGETARIIEIINKKPFHPLTSAIPRGINTIALILPGKTRFVKEISIRDRKSVV